MAKVTSGVLNSSKYDGRYYELKWEATQSIDTNQSTINWTLTAKKSGWWAERTLKVIIAGKTVINKTNRVERWDGVVATGSVVVEHNMDGSKAISASIQAAVYGSSVNCTGSASWELADIPRKATVVTVTDFNDEENPVIQYNNPLGDKIDSLEACISLDGSTDDIPYRAIAKDRTVYTFDLTEEERIILRNATLDGKDYRTVYFYIKTVVDGVTYLHSKSCILTIVNCKPILNPIAEDVNEATVALTGDNTIFVKGYSNARLGSNASALKGASIVYQSIIVDGSKAETTVSEPVTTIKAQVMNPTFKFLVRDNRGIEAEETVTRNLIEYIEPTCNQELSIELVGETEAAVTLEISGNYFNGSFGAVNNELKLEVRHTQNDGSMGDWVELTDGLVPTLDGNTYILTTIIRGFDYSKAYTFQCRASDKLSSSPDTAEYTVNLIPVFDWSETDFNFNVPVNLNNNTVLRANDTGRVVLSAEDGVYIRPKGTDNEDGQVVVNNATLSGEELKVYSTGTATIQGTERVDIVSAKNTNISTAAGASINLNTSYVRINGQPIDDFVKEQGNDGLYAYRIWNSGLIEAWRTSTKGVAVTTPTAVGSMYKSAELELGTTGSASQFVSIEQVQMTINGGQGVYMIPVVNLYGTSSGKATINYTILSPTARTTATYVLPYIYIVGRWK